MFMILFEYKMLTIFDQVPKCLFMTPVLPFLALKLDQNTVGGIAYICFKWFQITADAHPCRGVMGVKSPEFF